MPCAPRRPLHRRVAVRARLDLPEGVRASRHVAIDVAAGRDALDDLAVRDPAAIASKTPDGIRKWRPELSAELEAVILRCLSRDPDARPHASELAEQLLPFAPPGLEELVARTLATRVSEEENEDFSLTAVGRVMRQNEGREPWGRREWALAAVVGLLIVFAGIGVSAMTGRGRGPVDPPTSSVPSP